MNVDPDSNRGVGLKDERIQQPAERFRTAAGWAFVMNTARLASTIGTSVVLAALLGPRAFGIVALGVIYVTLLQLLMQQGVMPALIQRPELTRQHLDSAFWLTMGGSLALTAISVAAAGWWAELNNTPDAEAVILALSSLVVIKGLVVVQEALLRRQMQFRALAVRTTVASVAGSAVGLTWAIVAPSLWALVAQQLTTNIVGGIMLWGVSDWRPRLRFRRKEAGDIIGFASKSSLSGFGVFVNNRIDALLVGLYFGAAAVGLYRLASRLVESAIELTAQPIQHVSLPEFSRNQATPKRASARYCALVQTSAAVGGTVMAAIFATAQAFMLTLGDEWVDATTALQMLSVVGLVRVITMLNAPAVQAAGRPGAQAIMTWLAAGLSATSFIIAGTALAGRSVDVQVAGMAASRALLYVLLLLPLSQIFFVSRIVGVSTRQYARIVTPTVLVCAFAALVGSRCTTTLLNSGLASLAVLALVGTGTLCGAGLMVLAVNQRARAVAAPVGRRILLAVSPQHG